MVNYNYKKTYQILFNIFLLLVLPVSVLAPMGTWIPLMVLALITICFTKSFKNVKFDKEYMVLLLIFMLITILSFVLLNLDIKTLSRLLSLYFIIFSFITVCIFFDSEINFKSTSIQLTISFIVSFLIIILDDFYQIPPDKIVLWNFQKDKSYERKIKNRINFLNASFKANKI